MLSTLLEYINNIYLLTLIAVIVGLLIVYLYDLFEKKQYTNAVYLRIGILIYTSCILTIYISRLQPITIQSGGDISFNSVLPQANDIKSSFEQFKTGVPTF